MTIEKRYQQRHPCNIPAHLIYRRRSFSVTATDITAYGIGLKSDYLTIPSGNIIDLELALGDQQWHVSGLIIHIADQHIGIMFRSLQPELLETVQMSTRSPQVMSARPEQIRYSGPHSTR